MRRTTNDLIAALAADVPPVRRLKPPWLRAVGWLALLLAISSVAIGLFADIPDFVRRTGTVLAASAWFASLLTGATAIMAAANLSLPDRSRRWAMVPLPFLLLWIGLSGVGCWGFGPQPHGDSHECFLFLLGTGLPITAFLFWRLRQAHPLQVSLVAVCGALGAAGISAAVLQFFHPFQITWLDLAAHLAAASLLLAIGAISALTLRTASVEP